MKIAVIGLGYWGPNIVRNLLALHQEVYVYDKKEDKINSLLELYKKCVPLHSINEVLTNQSIEAIVLAVPLPVHCDLILRSLRSHKHVFVEKPLCFSLKEADAIGQALSDTVLMVGHITQYSRWIQRIAAAIRINEIGEIHRLAFTRTHFGPIYEKTDVLTEVAAHDISILTSFISDLPFSVQAWGIERLQKGNPDAAHIVFQWLNGPFAQIDVQWSSVIRRREIEVEGSDGTLLFRAHTQPEELFFYSHEKAFKALKKETQSKVPKDMVKSKQIFVESHEPLYEELSHFLDCIKFRKSPKTDFQFSRRVVNILEAARYSMEKKGLIVKL